MGSHRAARMAVRGIQDSLGLPQAYGSQEMPIQTPAILAPPTMVALSRAVWAPLFSSEKTWGPSAGGEVVCKRI